MRSDIRNSLWALGLDVGVEPVEVEVAALDDSDGVGAVALLGEEAVEVLLGPVLHELGHFLVAAVAGGL